MPEATPAQIASLGHVAALLRRELEKREWSVADFHRAIGEDVKSTRAYAWMNCRSRITDQYRPKIAKALGVKESDLMPRELTQAVITAPVSEAKLRAVQVASSMPARTLAPSGDVLAFNVNADGNARLRLDVTLPLEQGSKVLRLLLDHISLSATAGDEA
jgi:hypothetical protein